MAEPTSTNAVQLCGDAAPGAQTRHRTTTCAACVNISRWSDSAALVVNTSSIKRRHSFASSQVCHEAPHFSSAACLAAGRFGAKASRTSSSNMICAATSRSESASKTALAKRAAQPPEPHIARLLPVRRPPTAITSASSPPSTACSSRGPTSAQSASSHEASLPKSARPSTARRSAPPDGSVTRIERESPPRRTCAPASLEKSHAEPGKTPRTQCRARDDSSDGMPSPGRLLGRDARPTALRLRAAQWAARRRTQTPAPSAPHLQRRAAPRRARRTMSAL
mmetsp:Transcript_12177/g.42120  ORF Transcript_12177/g.42120 Transcript_12177/m.42120 type:complete len:280 (-) Transcript_12177:28-867(-)